MQLYTIQPENLYEKLLREKELTNNGDFLSDFGKDFSGQYKWMAEQMLRRGIEKPLSAALTPKYPFWAWYKYSSEKAKPDLRRAGHAPKGSKCLCMELDLPDDSVLLSNFDLWHCILNDMPVFAEDEWDDSYSAYKKLTSEEQSKIKNKSWETIFTDFSDSPVQATFWLLRLEDVRNIRKFTAR